MSKQIAEHDVVVLTQVVPSDDAHAGDVAVVLAIHAGTATRPAGYTCEISTVTDETAAISDVPADQVRPALGTDIRHTWPAAKIA